MDETQLMTDAKKETEYWRWTESRWTNPDIDWKDGDVVSAGVDVGSVSTQAVVMVIITN